VINWKSIVRLVTLVMIWVGFASLVLASDLGHTIKAREFGVLCGGTPDLIVGLRAWIR
jgi:hypothetical protein